MGRKFFFSFLLLVWCTPYGAVCAVPKPEIARRRRDWGEATVRSTVAHSLKS